MWDIKLTTHTRNAGWPEFEKNLSELITKYETDVEGIDFKLDTIKIKNDITKKTAKFFKKIKL